MLVRRADRGLRSAGTEKEGWVLRNEGGASWRRAMAPAVRARRCVAWPAGDVDPGTAVADRKGLASARHRGGLLLGRTQVFCRRMGRYGFCERPKLQGWRISPHFIRGFAGGFDASRIETQGLFFFCFCFSRPTASRPDSRRSDWPIGGKDGSRLVAAREDRAERSAGGGAAGSHPLAGGGIRLHGRADRRRGQRGFFAAIRARCLLKPAGRRDATGETARRGFVEGAELDARRGATRRVRMLVLRPPAVRQGRTRGTTSSRRWRAAAPTLSGVVSASVSGTGTAAPRRGGAAASREVLLFRAGGDGPHAAGMEGVGRQLARNEPRGLCGEVATAGLPNDR